MKESGGNNWTSGQTGERRRCPFLLDPSEDCFVTDMTSLEVEKAIHYCGGNFEKCAIYQERFALPQAILAPFMGKGDGIL